MMKFVLPRYLYQSMHTASPSLSSVETSYSFGREMIHCVQWMHPTPCVLSETALSGLQFIILAWHEAGKTPAADSPLLLFPLCYDSTLFLWLSLDLGPWLRHWKVPCKALENNTCLIMVPSFSHPQPYSPGRHSMGGRRAGVPGYPSEKNQDTGFFLCDIPWVSKEQDNLCDQVKNLLWKLPRTLDWAVSYKPACITCRSRHTVLEEYPKFENLGRTLPLSLYF